MRKCDMSPCSDRRGARVGRILAVALMSVLAFGLFAPPANAHSVLIRSDPAAGAVLSEAPKAVQLWFSEELSPGFSSARLLDGEGGTVQGARLVPEPGDPRSVVLELPALTRGTYGIFWEVLAENDGHKTTGRLVFSVGVQSPASSSLSSQIDTSAPPTEIFLYWLSFCLLAGIVGGLGVTSLVLGSGSASADPGLAGAVLSARRRVLFLVLVSAVAGTVAGVAVLVEQSRQVTSSALGASWISSTVHLVAATRWGHLWIAREVVLLVLAGAVWAMVSLLGRDRPLGLRPQVATGLALTVVGIQALGSHAAALESGRATAIAADALHLLTACLWIGALPALLLVLWPRSAGGVSRRDLARACRTPFTRLAATSVCLLVVTGLYSAGREVETVGGVVGTSYGRTLLVKGGLLALAGGLGLLNAARLHGWESRWLGPLRPLVSGRPPSRRLIRVEAGVGVVLFLAVSVLTATPPARGPAPLVAPEATRLRVATAEDLLVSVSVTPNRPGVNGFTVLANSSRRPAPAPIDDVRLQLTRDGRTSFVLLQEVDEGTYFGTGSLDAAGRWGLRAIVSRAGARLIAPVGWSVAPPARVAVESGRRLAPIANAIALSVLAAGLAVIVVRRRERPRNARGDRRSQPTEDRPEPLPDSEKDEEEAARLTTVSRFRTVHT
jgi:copper transport protein